VTEERRRHPRYPVDTLARFIVEGRSFEGRIRDICQEAVLVETSDPAPMGASVTMSVEILGGQGEVEITGRVVRLATTGLALLFTSLTPAIATQIGFFLELQD
jgi:hypothetical protein